MIIVFCFIHQMTIIGIPDHDVTQGNPNSPCEINWAITIPLNPTVANSKSELGTRGIVGMSLNGVPAYGPQEGGSTNAVEPDNGASITDAQYWYGHAAMSGDWHFHNPHMGQEDPSSTDLLGYALDGFPIYGPVSDASSLDECNGIEENGEYQYHVRDTDQVDSSLTYCNGSNPYNNWNYILGCFSGSLADTEVEDSTSFSLPVDCVLEDEVSETSSPIESQVSETSSPSESPPTPSCVDSPSRFKLVKNGNKITRGCEWAARKPGNRCTFDGIPVTCRATCGTCDTCTDSTLRFKTFKNGDKITRGCEWAATKPGNRCALEGVTETCPASCELC